MVYIIGAGAGDCGLITLRGLKIIKRCGCIIYDSLMPPELLDFAPGDCEKIFAGKRAGRHSMTQPEINGLIIKKAAAHSVVVRLKGGDPFVFGRGGEEAEALIQAGVPFELVPGISASIAAPLRAGIPVTHRGIAQSFHVITGSVADGGIDDYSQLAGLSGTLVFMMGLRRIQEIAEGLISAGMDERTPAAVVSCAYSPLEKTVRGSLCDISKKADGLSAPAVIVVGRTAAFDFSGAGGKKRPRVLAVGTQGFTDRLAAAIEDAGAYARRLPCMSIEAAEGRNIERAINKIDAYEWLAFTSANGVRIFMEVLIKSGTADIRRLSGVKLAAVGGATASELGRYGLRADYIPEEYTAAALGRGLASVAKGVCLIASAENASEDIITEMNAAGALYEKLDVYSIRPDASMLKECRRLAEDSDYIAFGSSAGVKAFLEAACVPDGVKAAAIGGKTAETLKKAGIEPLEAENARAEELAAIIMEDFYNG